MRHRGSPMSVFQISRIKDLLANTELSFAEIAQRMECSRTTIAGINQRFEIRDYSSRADWTVKQAAK